MAAIRGTQNRGDDAHDAAAFGARRRADGCLRLRSLARRGLHALDPVGQGGPAQGEFCGATAIGHEAEVADAVEAVWQCVQEKATEELQRREGALLALLGGEAHTLVTDIAKSMIGETNAVRVAAQVSVDLLGAPEGALGVDTPPGASRPPRRRAGG